MNILIVGNGFDRKIGLKTDYISFLDWMKEEGYGVGTRFFQNSEKIDYANNNFSFQNRLQCYKSFLNTPTDFIGVKFNIQNQSSVKYFEEPAENKIANNLLYLLPEIISGNKPQKTEKANIWYSFIQLLRYQKTNNLFITDISRFGNYLCEEGNWVDIEGLIQKSIEIRIQNDYYVSGIFSVARYFDIFSLANLFTMDINETYQRSKEEIYDIVWQDFLEFKKCLSEYLAFISSGIKNLDQKFIQESIQYYKSQGGKTFILNNINQFAKIINFNYVPLVFNHADVYHIHGDIDDREKIVFGLDVNLRNSELHTDERKTTFEIKLSRSKSLLRFSKLHQLLHLQVDKGKNNLGKVFSLTIIGHSIGEQDYSYYFSILDRNIENIEIVCLWYKYNEVGNNKESSIESLFEMITSYERYCNQRIIHKMIFEGRIKFKEVYIPRIIN